MQLAQIINQCRQQSAITLVIAQAGKRSAAQRFDLVKIEQQIDDLLGSIINRTQQT